MAITYRDTILLSYKDQSLPRELKLSSPVFENGDELPRPYRFLDGDNISPPLEFTHIPEGTESLLITFMDDDHPSQTLHWLVWNIPTGINCFEEGSIPQAAVIGKNDLTEKEYYGPSPIQGIHNYTFNLYALDTELTYDSDIDRRQLVDEIEGHVLDVAELRCYVSTLGEFAYE